MMNAELQIKKLLAEAGITVNGTNDWDIQVHNPKLYKRVLAGGSLALGESYMDGWWDAASLEQFFYKVLAARLDEKFVFSWPLIWEFLGAYLFNPQTPLRSFQVGQHHYDVGNDIYQAMLDPRLTYTCGYWSPPGRDPAVAGKDAMTLEEAQEAKLDLVCRKIGLKAGDSVFDIGCGWGSFLKFAFQKYGAKGVGVTVSKEQVALGQKMCEGLPVEIKLQDYRAAQGVFDHVVSLGMFEHVGVKNYRTYMEKAHQLLKNDGIFLLHTIGSSNSVIMGDAWTVKYIFPNSMLPSVAQIGKAIEGLFVMEDWHNFGADYDKTLMAWFGNFDRHWPELKGKYTDRFYRMWKYYLLSFAASFRARRIQLWQIVLSKRGIPGGYTSLR